MKVICVVGRCHDARGAYFALSNIWKAQETMGHIWFMGGIPFYPQGASLLLEGILGVPQERFLQGNLELVRRADAVYAMESFAKSPEAQLMVEEALKLSKPVFYKAKELDTYLESRPVPEVKEVHRAKARA